MFLEVIENLKELIKKEIVLNTNIVLEKPKKGNYDLAIPLFAFSKELNISINEVFEMFKLILIKSEYVEKVEFVAGFLNLVLNRPLITRNFFERVLASNLAIGRKLSNGKIVVIDYSAPNIAKNFGIGHLRSTVIGKALKNIYEREGYKVVSINHLGDWGTQFGKMIAAYKLWGSKKDLESVDNLQKLYVRFHAEMENDISLEDKGRHEFKQLESGNKENIELWEIFREISLASFMSVYDILDISFDSYNGEAFFNDKMDIVLELLKAKNVLKLDEGALVVRLDELDMPPALIVRSDGATLYMTRDLAALLYRLKEYKFDKILYVVGNEQKLHFNQLKAVSKKMGFDLDIEHVNFGLVLIDGKKLSTRQGKSFNLKDLLDLSIDKAKILIEEKHPQTQDIDIEKTAKAVGVGAVIFNDLKNERHLNIDLNIDQVIKFEGQTGPYLQYCSVRITSILKKQPFDCELINYELFKEDNYYNIVAHLLNYSPIITKACETNSPNLIARYLLELASLFNQFYASTKILVDESTMLNTNLSLCYLTRTVINDGLNILGITHLEKM